LKNAYLLTKVAFLGNTLALTVMKSLAATKAIFSRHQRATEGSYFDDLEKKLLG
jgi:hypothetical protein